MHLPCLKLIKIDDNTLQLKALSTFVNKATGYTILKGQVGGTFAASTKEMIQGINSGTKWVVTGIHVDESFPVEVFKNEDVYVSQNNDGSIVCSFTFVPQQDNVQKYELIGDKSPYLIKATKTFTNLATGKIISEGTIGGFVANQNSLSQEGTCWAFGDILEDARVSGDAYIGIKACITGCAEVKDRAIIGIISDDLKELNCSAVVTDDSLIQDEATVVCGSITDDTIFRGKDILDDNNVEICGNVCLNRWREKYGTSL